MPYKGGVYVEPTNEDRAGWALCGLNEYSRQTRHDVVYIDPDPAAEDRTGDLEEVASDMLCDLMHLLRRHGVDPTDIIDRAYSHFHAEVEEEEG